MPSRSVPESPQPTSITTQASLRMARIVSHRTWTAVGTPRYMACIAMQITPPQVPSRATGEIDRLLTALGHPPLADLDEDREDLAADHDELFEEIAAFARRGWAFTFDAETGTQYDARYYEDVLGEILRP